MSTNLAIDDVDSLLPFFFHNPVLDNALEVADHGCIVKIHIRATVALNQLVDSL